MSGIEELSQYKRRNKKAFVLLSLAQIMCDCVYGEFWV